MRNRAADSHLGPPHDQDSNQIKSFYLQLPWIYRIKNWSFLFICSFMASITHHRIKQRDTNWPPASEWLWDLQGQRHDGNIIAQVKSPSAICSGTIMVLFVPVITHQKIMLPIWRNFQCQKWRLLEDPEPTCLYDRQHNRAFNYPVMLFSYSDFQSTIEDCCLSVTVSDRTSQISCEYK